MFTFITLPTDFVANIGTYAGQLFTDISPVVELIVGLLLAVTIAGVIIHYIKKA